MPNTSSRLIVTDLDFDSIKQNFKNFLQTQDRFRDYNFSGSGLDVLLDVLAYNTHYDAFYLNMAANERFADTALLRDSLVSKGKELGYTPRSRSGAVANVTLTVTTPNSVTDTTLTLPRFTKFISEPLDGTNFVYCNTDDAVATRANANADFVFSNLEITQGEPIAYTFSAVNLTTNPKLRFDLPDAGIDTSTLEVSVRQSIANLTSVIYTKADDITELTANSKVYYLEGAPNGKYTIQFGDGIISKNLENGNIVTCSYLVTDGTLANGANNFSYFTGSGFVGGTTYALTTNSAGAGGALEDDVETIRFNALNGYSIQNRAVTDNDYEILLRQQYPAAQAIAVWGGEDNDPPAYGKVFISMKPKTGFFITASEKLRIAKDILRKKNIVAIIPEIVDPEYLYIKCIITAYYNSSLTTQSQDALRQTIRNAVLAYNNAELNRFNSTFRVSKLLNYIDTSSAAILGSDMEVILEKRLPLVLGTAQNYETVFNAELRRGGLNDRLYTTPAFTMLDGNGTARTAYIEETPLSSSGIDSISVDSPGYGYTNPTVTITGDNPSETPAVATAIVVNGMIESIDLSSRGAGYSYATVEITDPTGIGASATAVLAAQRGDLRSYYYNGNEKIIINENQGTIEYNTGTVSLVSFNPTAVDDGSIILRFICRAEKDTITPVRNNILVIDPDDSTAIIINLVAET